MGSAYQTSTASKATHTLATPLKPLPERIALGQAMAVWFTLYQMPLIFFATHHVKRSLLNKCKEFKHMLNLLMGILEFLTLVQIYGE